MNSNKLLYTFIIILSIKNAFPNNGGVEEFRGLIAEMISQKTSSRTYTDVRGRRWDYDDDIGSYYHPDFGHLTLDQIKRIMSPTEPLSSTPAASLPPSLPLARSPEKKLPPSSTSSSISSPPFLIRKFRGVRSFDEEYEEEMDYYKRHLGID